MYSKELWRMVNFYDQVVDYLKSKILQCFESIFFIEKLGKELTA